VTVHRNRFLANKIPIKLEFSASVRFIHKERIVGLLHSINFLKCTYVERIGSCLSSLIHIKFKFVTHISV
jgi:hypothetical protein